ncbi:hypothetical protein ACFE04_022518 [Oxalis oulophora]
MFGLVEEANFKSTTRLFGKKRDEKSLQLFIPKSESDFVEYAELISHKLCPYEESFHYLGLLKDVMRLSMANLKVVDAKEVIQADEDNKKLIFFEKEAAWTKYSKQIREGDVFSGRVGSVEDYGAFIHLRFPDGIIKFFVHIYLFWSSLLHF